MKFNKFTDSIPAKVNNELLIDELNAAIIIPAPKQGEEPEEFGVSYHKDELLILTPKGVSRDAVEAVILKHAPAKDNQEAGIEKAIMHKRSEMLVLLADKFKTIDDRLKILEKV